MRRFAMLAAVALCAMNVLAGSVAAQATPAEIAGQVSQASYQDILAGEANMLFTRQGDDRTFDWGANSVRNPTVKHQQARDNIYGWFSGYGLQTSYKSVANFTTTGGAHMQGVTNVMAVQPGSDPQAGYIILGAHYDAYGGPANPVPGADDNGSGTAGLLEAARVLSQHEFATTIIYMAFDAEERFTDGRTALDGSTVNNLPGGSSDWVMNNITNDPTQTDKILASDVKGMINMDMIAYRRPGVTEAGLLKAASRMSDTSPLVTGMAAAMEAYSDLTVKLHTNALSDHASFYRLAGIDAVALFEQVDDNGYPSFNTDYHSGEDYIRDGYLDYWYASEILRGVVGYTAETAVVVPEPTTVLLLVAAGGVFLSRRRRARVA